MTNQVVNTGAIIKSSRADRGWNYVELARRAKLSPSQISKLEKGYENLKCSTLNKIAFALGIKPCVFFMTHEDYEAFDKAVGVRWDGRLVGKPGAIIREFRIDKGLSSAALARLAKMKPPQMSKIENSQCYLTYQTLVRIARALDIKPCMFIMAYADREAFITAVGSKW